MMENKLSVFSIEGWKNLNRGVITFENSNIIGMINNPVDYVLDGYNFINRNKIKSIEVINNSTRRRIMNTKAQTWLNNFNLVKVSNFKELFEILKERDTFCELHLSKEDILYIGKIINVRTNSVDIDFYNIDFKLLDQAVVEFVDIKLVKIYSDYSITFENEIMGKW